MLNIHDIQRERTRLYKYAFAYENRNQLRKQFEEKQSEKKSYSMKIKSNDHQALEEKIKATSYEMHLEKQRENYIKNKLNEENKMLATIKNMYKEIQKQKLEEVPFKGNNLMDKMNQESNKRNNEAKQTLKKINEEYQQEENVHRMINKESKSHELLEDTIHMERLKQLESMRRQQHEDIKNRHSPQPKKAFYMYKKLQEMNDQYKKSLQSFAYNGKDILDVLKRDERTQTFQRNKRVQSELKMQMEQKKYKDNLQRQHIVQPTNLKNSMLSKVLFKQPPNYKKEYADFLVKQINESDLRKSNQKLENKQKMHINNIFGGQGGPQRLKMIKHVDRNLGIQSQFLRRVEPGNRSDSPYRMKNLYVYNGQNIPNNKVINPFEQNNRQMNPQKGNDQNRNINENVDKINRDPSQNGSRLTSSVPNNKGLKSYISYDLIKGAQKRYQI